MDNTIDEYEEGLRFGLALSELVPDLYEHLIVALIYVNIQHSQDFVDGMIRGADHAS